jgi:hypothetical protein
MKNSITTQIFFSLMIICMLPVVLALRNPAAVYCDSLGYNFTVDHEDYGDIGYCNVDGQKLDAWQFFLGKTGQGFGYCEKNNFESTQTTDCDRYLLESCQACIIDGKSVEVAMAMGLTFAESTCGDSVCGFPENHKTCPADCKENDIDLLCEGASDPDCALDSGKHGINWRLIVLIVVGILIVVIGIVIWRQRRKSKHTKRKSKK